jgi:hypothetical protein
LLPCEEWTAVGRVSFVCALAKKAHRDGYSSLYARAAALVLQPVAKKSEGQASPKALRRQGNQAAKKGSAPLSAACLTELWLRDAHPFWPFRGARWADRGHPDAAGGLYLGRQEGFRFS